MYKNFVSKFKNFLFQCILIYTLKTREDDIIQECDENSVKQSVFFCHSNRRHIEKPTSKQNVQTALFFIS